MTPAESATRSASARRAWLVVGRLRTPLVLWAVVALLCGWYLAASPLAGGEAFSLGGVAGQRLSGFSDAETSPEGRGFRWTDGAASLGLPARGPGAHVLAITLGAPWPDGGDVRVDMGWNSAPLVSINQGPTPRRYTLLIPPSSWGENRLGLASATFRPASSSDLRELGIVVFDVAWRSVAAPGWLAPAQAALIAAAATALYLLLRRAGIPVGACLLVACLLVAILVSMRHSDPRFAERWGALRLTAGVTLLAAAGLLAARAGPEDGPLPWRPWLRHHWPALAGYTALTALMLWPILARFTTAIPGHPGDAYEYLWKLQLFSDRLVNQHQSPTFLPDLMYPEGFELANSEITPANTLLGLPVTWLFGPMASFNALNVASYILSGFFSYLLIQRLGAGRLAAFVGGIAFAFTVRRFFQMAAGHLPLMPTQYLPLALYGLEGLLTRRRAWDAFVAAVGLALATWASLYYGTTFALFMAAYALLRLGPRSLLVWIGAAWRPLVVGAVVLIALVAPFAQPYLEIREQGSALRHSLRHLELHAALPGDYLLPNRFHPLFGEWAARLHRSDGGEHVVTLGYSVIALSALGLWFGRPRRLTAALAALMAGTFVLTLGPWLYLPGGGRLPLPALFIYEHVPILDGIRVWNRVVLYIALCAAILIGMVLTALPRRAYVAGSALAAALLLYELAAVARFTTAQPRAVDLWLSAQPDQRAAIELPVTPNGADVFYASFQGRPSSMWYGTFEPPLYVENQAALNGFPSERAIEVLERWGVGKIVVDHAALALSKPDWEARAAALPELERVYSEGGYSVFALRR